jgi:hypothetical protein
MEEFNIQDKQTPFYKYCPGTFEYILVHSGHYSEGCTVRGTVATLLILVCSCACIIKYYYYYLESILYIYLKNLLLVLCVSSFFY